MQSVRDVTYQLLREFGLTTFFGNVGLTQEASAYARKLRAAIRISSKPPFSYLYFIFPLENAFAPQVTASYSVGCIDNRNRTVSGFGELVA